MKKLTTEIFLERAALIHGDKYNYDGVIYQGTNVKVNIICLKHGKFLQTPYKHIFRKQGCPYCAGIVKFTNEEFIVRANKTHNNKYNYDKVEYVNAHSKVIITCPDHGDFLQEANSHILGNGCNKCHGRFADDTESFVAEAIKVHGDKYNYGKVKYIDTNVKVIIICPSHGKFLQSPRSHLQGTGCCKCGRQSQKEKRLKTNEEFVKDAKQMHGNKYNYDKVEYLNTHSKVLITCFKHGDFLQDPSSHLSGTGCPSCCESRGERSIAKVLSQLKLKFERQWRHPDCKNKKPLPFDFCVTITPSKKFLIEYNGRYHYELINISRTDTEKSTLERLEQNQFRDNIKNQWCQKNNVPLLVIHYLNRDIENTILNFMTRIKW